MTTSRYVCRTHELPVQPNGRGCPRCVAADARRRAAKASDRQGRRRAR